MITRDIPRGRTMCRGALRIILGLFEERHASRLSRWLEGQAPSILLVKDQTLKRHWDQRCRCDSYPDRVRKGGRGTDSGAQTSENAQSFGCTLKQRGVGETFTVRLNSAQLRVVPLGRIMVGANNRNKLRKEN